MTTGRMAKTFKKVKLITLDPADKTKLLSKKRKKKRKHRRKKKKSSSNFGGYLPIVVLNNKIPVEQEKSRKNNVAESRMDTGRRRPRLGIRPQNRRKKYYRPKQTLFYVKNPPR